MYALEPSLGMARLVDLNNDQTSEKGECSCEIERKMYVGPIRFLLRCGCGLEHQNGLRDEQDASRVSKLWGCQPREVKG